MSAWLVNPLHEGLEGILRFFYPDVCQICAAQRATSKDGYVCPLCWARPGGVQFIVPPFCKRCGLPFSGEISSPFECGNCQDLQFHFGEARAAVVATELILEVIHRYKYNGQLWFEVFLADLLIRQAKPALQPSHWEWIVPVPLHSVRQRERQFNQAERLAYGLSRATGIPTNTGLLKRAIATQTQTQLTRSGRAANVNAAFVYFSPQPLKGERIVLVDDVLTTAATTNECARVLRKNGAGEVCVWTVARGLQSR